MMAFRAGFGGCLGVLAALFVVFVLMPIGCVYVGGAYLSDHTADTLVDGHNFTRYDCVSDDQDMNPGWPYSPWLAINVRDDDTGALWFDGQDIHTMRFVDSQPTSDGGVTYVGEWFDDPRCLVTINGETVTLAYEHSPERTSEWRRR